MNILTGTARLSRDAEVRFTQAGKAICNFNAAMDSGYGESKKPVWLRMAIFGKRAEGNLPQYLLKGTQIAFSGELRVNEYDDKDGNKRTSIEVSVNNLDLIGGKQDNQNQPTQNTQQPSSQRQQNGNGNFPTQGGNQQNQQPQQQAQGYQQQGGQQQQRSNDPFAGGNAQMDESDLPF